MQVLFTKSSLIGSTLIRCTLDEPVSHCAILVGGFVVESTFSGVNITSLTKFKQKATIVYSVNVPYNTNKLLRMIGSEEGKKYDFGALCYLGLKVLLSYIGIKLPKRNLWQTTGMYLCTEFVAKIIDKKENSMITPFQLYTKLRKT